VQQILMEEGENPGWYLPHHPVQHQHKPEKLLKEPDFMSSLVSVLTKFRLEKVAIVGDVEQMFYQVYIEPKDRKNL